MHGSPIQTPVTGAEECTDQRQPAQALAQFYRALNSRDIGLMQRKWADSQTAMYNPLGGIKRGWSEIGTIYEKLFESQAAYRFEFYDYGSIDDSQMPAAYQEAVPGAQESRPPTIS